MESIKGINLLCTILKNKDYENYELTQKLFDKVYDNLETLCFGENTSFLVNHLIQFNTKSEFATKLINHITYNTDKTAATKLISEMITNQYAHYIIKSILTKSIRVVKIELYNQVKSIVKKLGKDELLNPNYIKFMKF